MVAAQIANELCQDKISCKPLFAPRVVLCGGIAADIIGRPSVVIQDNSNIGYVDVTCGGCVRDVQECLRKLGVRDSLLISAVGSDIFGEMLFNSIRENGLSTRGIYKSAKDHSAVYMCIMQKGDQATGVSDMEILQNIPVQHFAKFKNIILGAKVLALDANLSVEAIKYLCDIGKNTFSILR